MEIKAKNVRLGQGNELLRRLSPGMRKSMYEGIGEIVQASVQDNFQEGGKPAWKPLQPNTLKQRWRKTHRGQKRTRLDKKDTVGWARFRCGEKVLVESGHLSLSISYMALSNKVLVGPFGHQGKKMVPYAAVHQFGDESRNIPARPYLVIRPADRVEIRRHVTFFVAGGLL